MEEGRRLKECQMSGSFYLFLVVFIPVFNSLYALYVFNVCMVANQQRLAKNTGTVQTNCSPLKTPFSGSGECSSVPNHILPSVYLNAVRLCNAVQLLCGTCGAWVVLS